MSLLERGLAKLSIQAWKDRDAKKAIGSMEVMYNPENVHIEYKTHYKIDDSFNKASQSNVYVNAEPVSLNLELLFDGQMPGNTTPVEEQLATLKSLCAVEMGTGEPCFLRITWGKMRWENKGWFTGRANALSVTYTLFDRDATPLRASVSLGLVADESFVIQQNKKFQSSPNQAVVSVPDSDSLPALAANAGGKLGKEIDCLTLAHDNSMNHLDDLKTGRYLQVKK